MSVRIKEKSFDFALKTLETFKVLQKNREYIISKQLSRSATSIGEMVRESEFAESKKDFIHKLSIALKEANESIYWLDLLRHSNYLKINIYNSLRREKQQIIYILISFIKTSKQNFKDRSK